jgi:hypothetical protein
MKATTARIDISFRLRRCLCHFLALLCIINQYLYHHIYPCFSHDKSWYQKVAPVPSIMQVRASPRCSAYEKWPWNVLA